MSTPPHGAGREAGGSLLPVRRARLAQRGPLLAGGRIDGYLAGLSADAAVPLTRPRSPGCVAAAIRRDLADGDGVLGANLARARARRALDGLPAPNRSCAYG